MARRSRRVLTGGWGLAGLFMLGWTSEVAAQPVPSPALTWDAPIGCPTVEDVQARVATLLGGGVSRVADVSASGQVERAESGFRLQLSMSVGGAPSSRVIEARTCEELAGAAAIAIALLARETLEDAATPATTPTPGSAPEGQAEPKPTPPAEPDGPNGKNETPREPSQRGLRFVVDAPMGVAGWGTLPSTGLGLGAGLGIRWKALRVTARGELWQAQTHRVSGFDTHFTLRSGRVDACLMHELHGFELGPCLGAAIQRLTAKGVVSTTFSAGPERAAAWVSGAGGLVASVPTPGFAHLRFLGGASVLVSPAKPRFVIDQLGPVHEPALAAPRVDLGCEWIF